ncbi:MAG TPA: type I-D CRISPR-associated helicase Cas3' [Ktedonobacteraceae bacterium]|jgi:CRISPR-associated endonuclease/helicase Cas3|nr:type I-D CRISPR-associated helicase Cas3' [Ktedonobacteraceae bacterium]
MIQLELAPHYEPLANPFAENYTKLADALGSPPLYHQWLTYQNKTAHIVVNSFNTGTGKTKAALLRLLDLDETYKKDRYTTNANVLFIAPTNELLRQHEEDIQTFIKQNNLSYIVLRLDAATIRSLAQQHLSEKFIRQGDRLHQMLQDPRVVLTDSEGYHIQGHHPYILVINPDIFYYALYSLGNPHDQRVLFRDFILNFSYIVVDEFHYYNAKQLANFLFFLMLSREWGFFKQGRRVCLLTATPSEQVRHYLKQLDLDIAYIEPENIPGGLQTTPALAPVHLRLYSTEVLENGLVSLASQVKATIEEWLHQNRNGACISSALWRINQIYQEYGGKNNTHLGRLTGAESAIWREQHKLARLLLATPTVDIGYNFSRPGIKRQSIDFLVFDARSSDESIQRLGRAGRVLGKEEYYFPSDVWAVVPDQLLTELNEIANQRIERRHLNKLINSILPQKNGIFAYINSGAIAEAFLPIFNIWKALPTGQKDQAEKLYQAIVQAYGTKKTASFRNLLSNTQRYLIIKSHLPELLHEKNSEKFTFGPASVIMRTLDEQRDIDLDTLNTIDHNQSKKVELALLKSHKTVDAEKKRWAELEEFYTADVRFNFRDNFQPPSALAHDPSGFLATSEYTVYSALHIVQNYIADWLNVDQQQLDKLTERSGIALDKQIKLFCKIKQLREQPLNIHFYLNGSPSTKAKWEARYCSKLAARNGFRLQSDSGLIPPELNNLFEQNYITFYAVPAVGSEALALARLQKTTSLFTNTLRVDFANEGEHTYTIVLGSAALLVSYESNIIRAKFVGRRADSHIFDWDDD